MYFIKLIFELLIVIFLLRLFCDSLTVNAYNPIYRTLIKFTQHFIAPLQKLLPIHGKFNWPCLTLILIIKLVELLLLIWIQLNTWPHIGGLVIVAIGELLSLTFDIIFWAIIGQAILSWLSAINQAYSPITEILFTLTRPILKPIQRLIPPIGGIDLSPLPVLILLKLCTIYVAGSITAMGAGLIFV
jgi:YggT family protein